jgi:probable addiction module antidote protein
MAKLTLSRWRAEDDFSDPTEQLSYLQQALEDDDPLFVQAALGDIARARGMTQLAQEIDVGRESLYKSLSTSRNASFATIFKAIRALGFELTAKPLRDHPDADLDSRAATQKAR